MNLPLPEPTEPRPTRTASGRPASWDLMEGRLAAARVDDLLGEASSRLTRLLTEVDLPTDASDTARETLTAVEAARESIAATRRRLRTP